MMVANCPPFSPHCLEYAEVKALAPTTAKPIIMRTIAFPIPALPRYTTDIYATAEANRRYSAVYIIVFIPLTLKGMTPALPLCAVAMYAPINAYAGRS